MIRQLSWILWAMLFVVFLGCANLHTVSRTTSIPTTGKPDRAKAIHLDAQQRVVLVNSLGHFCAEPNPDALAAYASSLGLGASSPSEGSASLAQALQSSTGSIGLRTQSITLLRDTLYRICEAYQNGAIGAVEVATLLGRSEDLTAVFLAIEQLTGVVAASQVVLTGTTGSSAAANLLSNQKLLDAARKDEQEKKKDLDAATNTRNSAKETTNKKREEALAAQRTYEQSTSPSSKTPGDEQERLKGIWESKKDEQKQAESDLDAAEKGLKERQESYNDSVTNREALEASRESALTNATASATSAGQFALPIKSKELSKEATESIAKAVQNMVTKVLDKKYTEESCMAFLSLPINSLGRTGDLKAYERVRDLCIEVVSRGLYAAATKAESKIGSEANETSSRTEYGADANTDRLNDAIKKDSKLQIRLSDWLKNKNLEIGIPELLYGKEYAKQREEAIKDLDVH